MPEYTLQTINDDDDLFFSIELDQSFEFRLRRSIRYYERTAFFLFTFETEFGADIYCSLDRFHTGARELESAFKAHNIDDRRLTTVEAAHLRVDLINMGKLIDHILKQRSHCYERDTNTLIMKFVFEGRYLAEDPLAVLGLKLALDAMGDLQQANLKRLKGLRGAISMLNIFVSPQLIPRNPAKPARKKRRRDSSSSEDN